MNQGALARRAAGLSTAFPAPHFPSELDADVIAFDSGFANPKVLPELSQFAVNALSAHREESLQYAPPQGSPELREWIAGYMAADGCDITADHILIVGGAKHGIDLICRLLLDEGDSLVVTAPTYFTCIPIFRSFGAHVLEVDHDAEGLRVDELAALFNRLKAAGTALPKFVYNVVDFHNPTGATMTLARREALVELCAREGVFIVEDNPYRRVRFTGEAVPTLKALDRDDTVIHVGTFSKLIAPGLRIGWVAAHPQLIARMMQLKSDGGACPFTQRIIYDFCRSGAFEAHVTKVQAVYREHRDRMLTAVRRWLPTAAIDEPDGGYYLWLDFPPGFDGDAFAAEAAARKVNILAGSRFFAGPGGGYPRNRGPAANSVRLSYSYETLQRIDEGVERLARIYAKMAA